MSKAFTKETDDFDEPEKRETDSAPIKNYITPTGFAELQRELQFLLKEERPKIVETVRWAAGNGDRSENGDYIYGKRRLREIDRRVRHLIKRIECAVVVDTNRQKNLTNVFFGATVTYAEQNGNTITVRIVGIDEADLAQGTISWVSPVAKALLKSAVGDKVYLHTPLGDEMLEVVAIKYLD